jgi:DNA-binding response OmpR family regulator
LESVSRRRRSVQIESQVFEVGVFRVDCQTRSITRDNEPVQLTDKDFGLAALLLRNVGQLLSRKYLQQAIWARDVHSSRTLDTHLSRVRNKLKLTPECGWRLRAVYGYGYRLERLTASASRSRKEEPKAT